MEFVNKLNTICDLILSSSQLTQYQGIAKLNDLMKELNLYSGNNEAKLILKIIEIVNKNECKNINVLLIDFIVNGCNQGLLETDTIISSLISSMNLNFSNLAIVLRGITKLILSKTNKSYSLRNPTHPFIIILRNTNDSLIYHMNDLICQEIKYMYNKYHTNEDPVVWLKSFYLHVFLDKFQIKHKIAKFLVEIQAKRRNNMEFNHLKNYLNNLSECDMQNVDFIETLKALIGYFRDNYQTKDTISDNIFTKIIKITCLIDTSIYIDCGKLWENLEITIKKNKSLLNDEILEILAENIYRANFLNFKKFISFIKTCVELYTGMNKLNLAIFFSPIFNYLTCFGTNDTLFEKYKDLILSLLHSVDVSLNKIKYSNDNANNKTPDLSYYLQGTQVNMKMFNLLTARFILDDTNLCTSRIRLIIDIVHKWLHLSVTVVALFLFKLKISKNHVVLCELLSRLSDLAVNKNEINLLIRIFTSIIDSASARNKTDYNFNALQATCFYQLIKLFKMPSYERLIYPYLSKYILTKSNKSMDMNSLLIKAYCMNEVIQHRPEYYTPQLLSIISEFLNTWLNEESSGSCALLMDTLGYLCRSEIIEIKSTWNAISTRIMNESRILVLNAFCRFISNASELKLDTHEVFVKELIAHLWQLIRDNENSQVINSAFDALSHFDSCLFKCHHLSTKILDKLKAKQKYLLALKENEDKTLDEIFFKIPSSCFFDLFENLHANSFKGFEIFLTKMLKRELDTMPKRVVYFNTEKQRSREEQQECNEKIFGNFSSYVMEEMRMALKDVQLYDVRFLLLAYETPVERDMSSGRTAKRHMMMHWRNYEQTLTLIFSKSKFQQIDQNNLMLSLKSWKRFIERAYNACVKSLQVETQLQIDDNPHMSQTDLQSSKDRLKNSSIYARNKIALMIATSLSTNFQTTSDTACYDTAILALVGLIQASSSYTKPLEDKSMLKEHSQWLEGLTDLSLNIKETQNVSTKKLKNQQAFPLDLVNFLKESFIKTQIFELMLAEINTYCQTFRIGSYLRDFIQKTLTNAFKTKASPQSIIIFGLYTCSLIKSTDDFSINLNKDINELLKLMYDEFLKASEPAYLLALTIALCCLYDENSVFYDEKNMLKTLLDSNKMSFDKDTIVCIVCLTCVAYKANLIENKNVLDLYDQLVGFNDFKDLLAFYLRFLLAYGFNGSLNLIQKFSSECLKNLQDNIDDEALSSINGLLSIVVSDSIHTTFILSDKALSLKSDLEKLIKPEAIMRCIVSYLKKDAFKTLKTSLLINFSIAHSTHLDLASENLYSIPSSYDYLDDYSVLKEITNTLIQWSSSVYDSKIEKKFILLIGVLKNGCTSSVQRSLPPINWFYLMSSLLKSSYGKVNETNLFELTLVHLEKLSSAFGFLRSFLISLNTFNQFKTQTQHLILNNLNLISRKFDSQLHSLVLSKIKIFLNNESSEAIIVSLLNGLIKCFQEFNSQTNHQNKIQLVEFFQAMFTNQILNGSQQIYEQTIDKVVDCFMLLNDENLTENLLVGHTDDFKCFKIVSNIKFELVSRGVQSIVFINDLIELVILNVNAINVENQCDFIQIFGSCVINSYKFGNELKVDDAYTNWFVEFMSLVHNISIKTQEYSIQSVDFACEILIVFIVSMNIAKNKLNNPNSFTLDSILYHENLDSAFKNLIQNTNWKNISIKIIDLMTNICLLKRITLEKSVYFERFLTSIRHSIELPNNIYFKYMQIIENKI